MTTVLAALDASPAARAVIETALGVGDLMGADVEAVHVGRPTETLETLTANHGVPLHLAHGPAEKALLDAAASPGVVAAVLGARATPSGRRPTGRTALAVMQHTDKPTVVVPPDAVGVSPRPFRRLLVPLEGSEASSRPVIDRLCPLIVTKVELVVLHVFTAATVPRVLDHPGRDLELLGDEFLTRHCPYASRIEWRTGPVGARVTEAYGENDADLVVLSWSQDSSAGHAAVVHDVLAASTIPVLLLPVATGDLAAADG
jgi:nucleotide-binding universal stress UspA family protein